MSGRSETVRKSPTGGRAPPPVMVPGDPVPRPASPGVAVASRVESDDDELPVEPPGDGADTWVVAGCLAHAARASVRTITPIVTAFLMREPPPGCSCRWRSRPRVAA